MNTIDFSKCKKNNGCYAEVALYDESKKAIKIFKKHEAGEEHVKNVFNSEVEAYKIASQNKLLSQYIPKFFGECKIEKVFDEYGNDISDKFVLECAYEMELITDTIISNQSGYGRKNYEYIMKIFKDEGIYHLSDIAYTLDEEDNINKIIDFAVKEYQLWR